MADCRASKGDTNLLIPNQEDTPPNPSSVFAYHQGRTLVFPSPAKGPLTSISVMSGSSGAQGGMGTGNAIRLLSSTVESVPEESVSSMVARLSRDTLVQAEDRLRFRQQCIGS